jgi:hypothetical protein
MVNIPGEYSRIKKYTVILYQIWASLQPNLTNNFERFLKKSYRKNKWP